MLYEYSKNFEYLKNISELELCKENLIFLLNKNLDNDETCNLENFVEWMNLNQDNIQSFTNNFPNDQQSFEYWLIKALFCFARKGNLSELKLWINLFNIKDLNIFSDYGNSILSCACYNNMFHVASFLIKKGANVNTKNNKGKTALHRIMENNEDNQYKEKIVNLLKENGAKIDYIDKDGNTALHYALENKNIYYASLLIKFNADTKIKNKDYMYPIHLLVRNIKTNLDIELFDKIVDKCDLDINILDKYGNNLLLYSFGKNNYIFATHLIKKYKMNINNNTRISEYIFRYIDNNWVQIFKLFLDYFPNYIDVSTFKYCKKNNELIAWHIAFYIGYNSMDGSYKDNLNGKDPISVIGPHIENLITA